jgi:hypothetical protein
MTSITPIFPRSSHDAESQIISFLDDRNLVVLSGVNRSAYHVLSNKFFNQCFADHHPYLAKFDNVFKVLRDGHPNNCWKVVCCALSERYLRISPSFVREAVPLIREHLISKKMQYEMEIEKVFDAEKRIACSEGIKSANIKLASEDEIVCEHEANLGTEYLVTSSAEEAFVYLPVLKECSSLIQRVIDKVEEPTPLVLNRITDLLDHSFPEKGRNYFWGILFIPHSATDLDLDPRESSRGSITINSGTLFPLLDPRDFGAVQIPSLWPSVV